MDEIHFITMLIFEILIGSAHKYSLVGNGRVLLFTGFEFYLALKMDVAAQKNPLINVVIEGFYRDPQLRMVGNNHVRRLPLGNKQCNGFIEPMLLFFGKIDPFSGRYKEFFVLTVGGFGIVIVFGLYGTHMPWFTAAIADIRSLLNLAAVFPFKTATDTVAAMAGAA